MFLKKAKPITVPKQKIYCSLPYYNTDSENMAKRLKNIIHEFFPQVQLHIALTNSFTVGSIFNYKDKLHCDLRANIINKYECSDCNTTYVGSSRKKFKIRVYQHLGISSRTGQHLTTVMQSDPRNHSETHDHSISRHNFKILNTVKNSNDLHMLLLIIYTVAHCCVVVITQSYPP